MVLSNDGKFFLELTLKNFPPKKIKLKKSFTIENEYELESFFSVLSLLIFLQN